MGTEVITYSRIGKEDIRFGKGTFEVVLADGRKAIISEVDVGAILNDSSLSTPILLGWINVQDAAYGATGDGSTDDTGAIQAAIDAAVDGDTIYFPRPSAFYRITATITVNKRLHLLGSSAYGSPVDVSGSLIQGTGFSLFTMTSSFVIEHLVLYDPTGHANTIGVDINNGASGVVKWTIKNCTINCITASYGTLGTGVRGIFALEGVIENSTIEGWLNGIDWQDYAGSKSNSNDIRGCKIRQNTIGILSTSVDNASVSGSTMEGNSTGVKILGGRFNAISNHFENNAGDQREIHVVDGSIISIGNGFYAGGSDKDIYIESGAGIHMSYGDTLNAGITHNGTGLFTLNNPPLAPIYSGTGPLARSDGFGITALQGMSGYDLQFSGYNNVVLAPTTDVQFKVPLVALGGGGTATLGTVGGAGPTNTAQNTWIKLIDTNGNPFWLPVWK